MKKLLLLIIGFCMISLMSFGKSVTENSFATANESRNPFYANAKAKTTAIERHRVWLNLTNADGLFKQILVGYIAGATNGIDNGYDGVSMNANPYLDFYSVNGDKNLVIQGRALPFLDTDEVPLGYRTTIESTFTITIDEVDGNLTNQDIFIEDKDNNVVHNLKDSPYSFTTMPGTFKERFVLRYIDNPTVVEEPIIEDLIAEVVSQEPIVNDTIVAIPVDEQIGVINTVSDESIVSASSVVSPIAAAFSESTATEPTVFESDDNVSSFDIGDNFDKKEKEVVVSATNNQIKVNSRHENIDSVQVFDLGGKKLYQIAFVNSPEFVISNIDSRSSFLIVRTQLKDGTDFVNKIGF